MRIFISWSTRESKQIAELLKRWLSDVFPVSKPYMSASDIQKGERWALNVSRELNESSYGVICLTPNNISSPWINFEAGALAKVVESSRVTAILCGKLTPSSVTGPLSQFQNTLPNKKEFLALVQSINNQNDDGAKYSENQLHRIFEKWWPDFEEEYQAIEFKVRDVNDKRTDRNILEEVLELSRQTHKRAHEKDRSSSVPLHSELELELDGMRATLLMGINRRLEEGLDIPDNLIGLAEEYNIHIDSSALTKKSS